MQNFRSQLRKSIDNFEAIANQNQVVNPGSIKKPVTQPKLSERQNLQYEKGKEKLLNRKDKDRNAMEYEMQASSCTFQPQLPSTKPVRNQPKRSESAAQKRVQQSIERDIEARRKAYVQKQIADAVKEKGGWPRDYANMLEEDNKRSEKVIKRRPEPKAVTSPRSMSSKRDHKSEIVDYYNSA